MILASLSANGGSEVQDETFDKVNGDLNQSLADRVVQLTLQVAALSVSLPFISASMA